MCLSKVVFSHLNPTCEWLWGVSLQPPAYSQWTRAPVDTTPCAGTSTQQQKPVDPSSLGDAKGTATALKPKGSVNGCAKSQQVRNPLGSLILLLGGSRKTHPGSVRLHCLMVCHQGPRLQAAAGRGQLCYSASFNKPG